MNASLWRHEIGRVGWPGWAAPVAAVGTTAVLALLARASGSSQVNVNRVLLAGLEATVPLAISVVVVTIIARDVGRELHLALPRAYLATLGRRVAVVGAGGAVISLLIWLVLLGAGWWSGPGPAGAPLVWLAPTLALSGFALLLAALGRSVVVATTAVAAVWIGEQLYAGALAMSPWGRPLLLFLTSRVGSGEGWLTNRLVLSLTGLAMVAAAAWLVRRGHRLLDEEER